MTEPNRVRYFREFAIPVPLINKRLVLEGEHLLLHLHSQADPEKNVIPREVQFDKRTWVRPQGRRPINPWYDFSDSAHVVHRVGPDHAAGERVTASAVWIRYYPKPVESPR